MGPKQTIDWDEGNYQNLGPARLPSTHWTMLGYCRELGVPLEVEINTSRSTLLQNDSANGGKPVVQRKAVNDTRGHVSELLSKCIAQGALDSELTAEDKERMTDVSDDVRAAGCEGQVCGLGPCGVEDCGRRGDAG